MTLQRECSRSTLADLFPDVPRFLLPPTFPMDAKQLDMNGAEPGVCARSAYNAAWIANVLLPSILH